MLNLTMSVHQGAQSSATKIVVFTGWSVGMCAMGHGQAMGGPDLGLDSFSSISPDCHFPNKRPITIGQA